MKQPHEFFRRLRKRFAQNRTDRPAEEDNFFIPGETPAAFRDRVPADFRTVIEQSLIAWREDPIARRIVNVTTQFSIGRGFRIAADDPGTDEFLHEFWENPLNHMDARLLEWSDELCRTGNLFIMLASDSGGMSYVRAIPSGLIEEIIPMENDIEQPMLFRMREAADPARLRIPEEKTVKPASLTEPGTEECMLHFTVNRPIGGQWGESDLAPVLLWMERYRQWLQDRADLNHYRSSFIYMVKSPDLSEPLRSERQAQLNRSRLHSGMIYVVGQNEEWQAVHPNLDSSDANEDGLALKKMIAAGAGIPLSFLAESGTASKAESSGMEDSTCRNFRQRQQTLLWITETILRHVLARGALVRRELNRNCEIHVFGDDIASPGMSEGGIIHEKPQQLF